MFTFGMKSITRLLPAHSAAEERKGRETEKQWCESDGTLVETPG